MSLLTLYLVRIHAACLIVHGSIGECVVTAKDGILSLITARYALASPRTVETAFSAAYGSVSVTLVAESASLVLQDDILLPLCPVAIVELLHCLHVDKSVHTLVTQTLGCCCDNAGHVHLLGVRHHRRVDGSRRGVCSHKEARYLQRASISHVPTIKLKLRYNCTDFSTVLDVVNRVLGIRHTSCTRVDSESVSDCVVPSRSDRECLDL